MTVEFFPCQLFGARHDLLPRTHIIVEKIQCAILAETNIHRCLPPVDLIRDVLNDVAV